MNDVDHGDLNGIVPRLFQCGCFPVPLFVLVCRALPLVWSPSSVHFNNHSGVPFRVYSQPNTPIAITH